MVYCKCAGDFCGNAAVEDQRLDKRVVCGGSHAAVCVFLVQKRLFPTYPGFADVRKEQRTQDSGRAYIDSVRTLHATLGTTPQHVVSGERDAQPTPGAPASFHCIAERLRNKDGRIGRGTPFLSMRVRREALGESSLARDAPCIRTLAADRLTMHALVAIDAFASDRAVPLDFAPPRGVIIYCARSRVPNRNTQTAKEA
ncbi:hypothetical protein HPB50_009888 [Hyalomma asiaticum]|uniref:Uncharacterized protein n=1 Tax=Hyalomma asiaticum TaxID=266040 RepID=A0ACB7RJY6_HYAAI|nr:hypothetical protein HPB50_009888 [Hyalomma asiaticum]